MMIKSKNMLITKQLAIIAKFILVKHFKSVIVEINFKIRINDITSWMILPKTPIRPDDSYRKQCSGEVSENKKKFQ